MSIDFQKIFNQSTFPDTLEGSAVPRRALPASGAVIPWHGSDFLESRKRRISSISVYQAARQLTCIAVHAESKPVIAELGSKKQVSRIGKGVI